MMLVAARYGRRGLGRALMEHLLRAAGDDATVTLFATDMGRPLYEKLGFEAVRRNVSFRGQFRARSNSDNSKKRGAPAPPAGGGVRARHRSGPARRSSPWTAPRSALTGDAILTPPAGLRGPDRRPRGRRTCRTGGPGRAGHRRLRRRVAQRTRVHGDRPPGGTGRRGGQAPHRGTGRPRAHAGPPRPGPGPPGTARLGARPRPGASRPQRRHGPRQPQAARRARAPLRPDLRRPTA